MSSFRPFRTPESTSQRRTSLYAAIVLLGVVPILSWPTIAFLLQSNRGLDLTDEGLYLLAADPPGQLAAWGFPFGWHTRPLFALTGYDIAAFRTLGGVLLVTAMTVLGYLLALFVQSLIPSSKQLAFWARLVFSVTGTFGALLYYVSMLRTPSYNWLVLMGIIGASCGALLWCLRTDYTRTQVRNSYRRWVPALLIALLTSFFLFLTVPAKPSVLPMMMILGTALVFFTKGAQQSLTWFALVAVFLPICLGMAVLTGAWPFQFVEVFRLALGMPMPSPAHTPQQATLDALLLARETFAQFGEIPDVAALTLLLAMSLLAAPLILRRHIPILSFLGFGVAAFVAASIAGVPVPGINSSGRPYGLATPTLTTALLVLCAAVVLATLGLSRGNTRDWATGRRSPAIGAVCLYLVFLPFVFSFGSDNGIYGQASLAGGFFLLASQTIVLVRATPSTSIALSAVTLITTIGFVAAGLIGGWRFPHRMDGLALQTIPTEIGLHGSVLNLTPELSETISSLRSQAAQRGWNPGETPILDISYTWHPGIPYALGGTVPRSLQLTIFGYAASHDIATYHLSEPYLVFPFSKAWLLLSNPLDLNVDEVRAVEFTVKKVSFVAEREFPKGYSCFSSGGFLVWFPKIDGAQFESSCAGSPS